MQTEALNGEKSAMFDISPRYAVDKRGKPVSVLLKFSEFQTIMDYAQDHLDLREIDRLTGEPRFAWEDVMAERQKRKTRKTGK